MNLIVPEGVPHFTKYLAFTVVMLPSSEVLTVAHILYWLMVCACIPGTHCCVQTLVVVRPCGIVPRGVNFRYCSAAMCVSTVCRRFAEIHLHGLFAWARRQALRNDSGA